MEEELIAELLEMGYTQEQIDAEIGKAESSEPAQPYDAELAAELKELGYSDDEIFAELGSGVDPETGLLPGEEEGLDFNLNFLKFDETQDDDGVLDADESAKGSWNNFIDNVSLIDDKFFWLSEATIGQLLHEEFGIEGGVRSQNYREAEARIKKTEEGAAETIGFTDLDDVYEERGLGSVLTGGIAATFNAITGFASSVAISAPTLGGGLIVDMVAGAVRDHNQEKADELGISMEELFESGQQDLLTPITIGSIQYLLEKKGLDKVADVFKAVPSSWKKVFVNSLLASGAEGGTEFTQGLLDATNIGLAREGEGTVTEEVVDYLKHEALETTLQGAVGGKAIAGVAGTAKLARRKRRAARMLRTGEANEVIDNALTMVEELDGYLANPELSEEDKQKTLEIRDGVIEKLNQAVEEPYEVLKTFSEEEIEATSKIGDKIIDLEEQFAEYKNLPEGVKKIAQAELQAKIDEEKQKIEEIQKAVEQKDKDIQKQEEKIQEAKQAAKEASAEQKETANKKVKDLQAEMEEIQNREIPHVQDYLTPAETAIESVKLDEETQQDVQDLQQFRQEKQNQVDAHIAEAQEVNTKGVSQEFTTAAVETLSKAYPNTKMVFKPQEFKSERARLQQEGYQIPENAKGFVADDVVYLDLANITKDTPFHEFSHLWVRDVVRGNPQLFVKGWELIQQSPEARETIQRLRSIPAYAKLDSLKFREEVMANLIGKRAVIHFENAQEEAAWKKWLKEFTDWIKNKLGIDSEKGFDQLTYDDFVDIGAKSVITGDTTAAKGQKHKTGLGKGISFSLDQANEKDLANTVYNIKKKARLEGRQLPRGWAKQEEYQAEINEELEKVVARRLKKEGRVTKAKTQKTRQLGPETKPVDNETFQGSTKEWNAMMAKKGAEGVKRAWSQTDKKLLYAENEQGKRYITDEQIGIAIASLAHNIEDGMTHASIWSQLGKAFKFKNRPEGMTRGEYNAAKYDVGAGIMEFLERTGKIKTVWDYQLGSYAIEVIDNDYFDGMSDSAALFVDNDDYASVFINGKPPKDDADREYFTRTHPDAKMDRKNQPKVFQAIDAADAQEYEIDQEQMANLEQFNERGLLIEQDKEYTDQQLRSIKRSIKAAFTSMRKVGDQWFTQAHKLVHNGRVMSAAQGLTHQGSKFILSGFSFRKKEKMGKGGLRMTKILATDTYGYSGGDSFQSREDFFEKNREKWIEIAKDPWGSQENIDYIMNADEPTLFLRYITELKNAYEYEDGPENFPSGLPNHMDATTSGIQFLAALSGDKEASKIANITATDKRYDSYMNIVQQVWENKKRNQADFTPEEVARVKAYEAAVENRRKENEAKRKALNRPEGKYKAGVPEWDAYGEAYQKFKEEVNNQPSVGTKEDKALAAQYWWSDPKRQKKMRKIFKKPVMTKYYSAKPAGISDSIYDQFSGHKDFKGINKVYTYWMADEIFNAADEVFTGPGKILSVLKEIAIHLNAKNGYVRYTQSDGFIAANDPKETKNREVTYTSPEFGKVGISVAYNTDVRDLSAQKRQIAPFVVHSFDAALVRWLYQNVNYPLQTIHDSFATTPAHTEQLYKDVRKGFAELAQPSSLKKILEEMLGDAALAEEYFNAMIVGDFNVKGQIEKNPHGFSAGVTNPNIGDQPIEVQADKADNVEAQLTSELTGAKASITKEEARPC